MLFFATHLYDHFVSVCRSSTSHSSPMNQEGAGPSDLQSISESLKSKFNAMSMKYDTSSDHSSILYFI